MTLTRKEKLLIYCLGRKITVYQAAEAWTGKKGTKIKNLGPWYACKTELIKEGLITQQENRKGRDVIIEADINKFWESTFPSQEVEKLYSYMLKKYVIQTFKKYIKKIIDFGLELEKEMEERYNQKVFFNEDYERSNILLLFSLISIWSCDEKEMDKKWSDSNIKKVYDSISWLTQGEDAISKDIIPEAEKWKPQYKWNKTFWMPRVKENFSKSERKELCFGNMLSKSKKRVKRFFLLIHELMPSEYYKKCALSQVKSKLKVENSLFTKEAST